jgi:hypothetical protein
MSSNVSRPEIKSVMWTSHQNRQDTWHLPFRVLSYFLFTDNSRFGRGFEASITGFFPVKCVEKYSLMLGFIIVKTRLRHSVFRL